MCVNVHDVWYPAVIVCLPLVPLGSTVIGHAGEKIINFVMAVVEFEEGACNGLLDAGVHMAMGSDQQSWYVNRWQQTSIADAKRHASQKLTAGCGFLLNQEVLRARGRNATSAMAAETLSGARREEAA